MFLLESRQLFDLLSTTGINYINIKVITNTLYLAWFPVGVTQNQKLLAMLGLAFAVLRISVKLLTATAC